jgi:hypothetical protein
MDQPLTLAIVIGAGAIVVLVIVTRWWQRRREARIAAQRSAAVREQFSVLQIKQQEVQRLGSRIIATSSTGAIAGFTIVRQIEAVFTDGHATPGKAVIYLKALGAQKGANALINLVGERLPGGKCVAQGDAVIVRPIVEGPAAAKVKNSE